MAQNEFTLEELKAKTYFQLRDIAKKKGIDNATFLTQDQLIESLLQLDVAADKGAVAESEKTARSLGETEGYTREDFEKMTIHSVRSIVREVGITPSVRRKEELIEDYLKLMEERAKNGGVVAEVKPKTKRGRPAKSEVPNLVKDVAASSDNSSYNSNQESDQDNKTNQDALVKEAEANQEAVF